MSAVPAKRTKRSKRETPLERDERIQKELTQKLDADAYTVYQEIVTDQRDLAQRGLDFYYMTGRRFNEVFQRHKKRGVTLIAKYAELAPATVRRAMAFANAYDEDGLIALKAAANAKGEALTFNHITALLAAKEDTREDLLKATLTENLTPEALRQRIQADYGGKRSGGGRPPGIPQNFILAQDKLGRMTAKWINYLDSLNKDGTFDALLRQTPREKVTPQLRGELEKRKYELSLLAQRAAAEQKQVEEFLAYVDELAETETETETRTDTEAEIQGGSDEATPEPKPARTRRDPAKTAARKALEAAKKAPPAKQIGRNLAAH